MICPLSPAGDCRFCSDEYHREIRDACDVKTHRKVMIKKIIPLGLLCNNSEIGKSPWVVDTKECPKTAAPATAEPNRQMPRSKPVKQVPKLSTPKERAGRWTLQEQTERELAKLRSPTPNYLGSPDSSKKSRKRIGQQTLL
jgi:hypothetical protein